MGATYDDLQNQNCSTTQISVHISFLTLFAPHFKLLPKLNAQENVHYNIIILHYPLKLYAIMHLHYTFNYTLSIKLYSIPKKITIVKLTVCTKPYR